MPWPMPNPAPVTSATRPDNDSQFHAPSIRADATANARKYRKCRQKPAVEDAMLTGMNGPIHRKGNNQMDELMPTARELLHEWVQSESLRKHCEAVSACMRHFARKNGADEDLWGAVGLLHDMDFEKHPVLEWTPTGHTFVTVAYLKEHGWSEEITRAVASHAGYSGIDPGHADGKDAQRGR